MGDIRIVLIISLYFCTFYSYADNDPRDYYPMPAGTKAITIYNQTFEGNNLYSQGKKIDSNYDFSSTYWVAKGTRYWETGSMPMVAQLAIVSADLNLDWPAGGIDERRGQKLGDPVFLIAAWPYINEDRRFWVATSGWLTIPLGSYDNEELLNVGSNRWAYKHELNFTYVIQPGLHAEITGAVEFYSDNKDYTSNGLTLKQDHKFTLEGHLSNDITNKFQVSLDYYFHHGGEQEVDGISKNNGVRTHSIQFSTGYALTKDLYIRALYRKDFEVENGLEAQSIGLRLIKFL